MRHGRRKGPPGTPTAWETEFGWVLTVPSNGGYPGKQQVTVNHDALLPDSDILRRFWELEEPPHKDELLTPEEQLVVDHFKTTHYCNPDGRFIVPLPKKPDIPFIGESRTQAVRCFANLEHTLHAKGAFPEVDSVILEYMSLGHAEEVPKGDMDKPLKTVYYFPIHVVYKQSSTTTNVRAVFDASAKSRSGISLNDSLLVGPTVHPPLLDVLLRFRSHRIALTADVTKMYRAISLADEDRDFDRFVWRSQPDQPLKDYRMTRVTFGVSASSFTANMAVRKNAEEYESSFPLAAKAVRESFYVDDGLTGADSIELAIKTRSELQQLFGKSCFLLRKWNSSNSEVLHSIPTELRDSAEVLCLSKDGHRSSTTLGINWHAKKDEFHIQITEAQVHEELTKRKLLSNVSKVYDVLGWFSSTTVLVKLLIQQTWMSLIDWDELVSDEIQEMWKAWQDELHLLLQTKIPRCYYPDNTLISHKELHGFCDASEKAYAGVIYVRFTDSLGNHGVSLVTTKTKIAPIKPLIIPKLELCGALLVTRLLNHARSTLDIPL